MTAVTCRWFAACDQPATRDVPHPILGTVPACARCARRAWPKPTTDRPDDETLESWIIGDDMTEATDGCEIEPDGTCQHGHPSWLLRIGLI